ncbi:hypothetical protein [Mobiluncus mulieris]|uniref:DNA polymerase III subunit beta family protein n=1 Tax=Mobiluncus mulieris TaxID=2052 RepID=UPI0014706280|nr:hypothetical protein [Mobiluncus mulieris]NMX11172.1 hypothetical protein [Mobiluncus mulieris]
MENSDKIQLSIEELRGILATQFAASTDKSLPLLSGIHLRAAEEGGLIAEATDRYRTTRAYLPGVKAGKLNAVLHAKEFVVAARRVIDRYSEKFTLTVTWDKFTLVCEESGDSASGKMLSGDYPVIDRIYPVNAKLMSPLGPIVLNAEFLNEFDSIRKTLKAKGMLNVKFARSDAAKPQAWLIEAPKAVITGCIMPIRVKDEDTRYIDSRGLLTQLPGTGDGFTDEQKARLEKAMKIIEQKIDAVLAKCEALRAEAITGLTRPSRAKKLADIAPVVAVIDSEGVHGDSKLAEEISDTTGVPVAHESEGEPVVTVAKDKTPTASEKKRETPKPKAKTRSKAKGKTKVDAPEAASVESEAAPITDTEKREKLAEIYSMTPKMIERIFTALTDKGMNPEDACEWALGDHKRTSKRYLAALEIVRSA